jgi:hypothetical protein
MQIYKEEIGIKGRFIMVDALRIDNKTLIVQGNFIKTARLKEEWYEDVENPESLILAMKDANIKPDIFTFWQRLPDINPKYNYYMEWENIAAIPVKSYDHWFKNQINSGARKAIKNSVKRGVDVRLVDFNDDFIKGMTRIFNETPIRRGKTFWHYGKDFETVKREFFRNLFREDIIGAYYKGELIGFAMIVFEKRYASFTQLLSKIEHFNKNPNNALIAKAVKICDENKIPYITYGKWRRGSHADFLRHNGFEKILVPRYYVPLTIKGKIILKLKIHHGIKGILPEKMKVRLLDLRAKWYARKYAQS